MEMNQKKETSIVEKSASISLIVIIGKVLGFIKQAVIAWAFGANSMTDVYFAADGYSSMFGQIMSQTVGSTVLTQYIHLNERGEEKASKKLIRDSYVFFASLSLIVIFINYLFADKICGVIGISYSSEQRAELKYFLVAMLPVMLFTSMIGVSSGYLDSHNRFLPGRLTSLFFSISIIFFVVLFKEQLGLRAFLYGFLLGYIFHMILMLALVLPKVGIGRSNPFNNPEFVVMIKRFLPLVIGISVVDLGHLVDKMVASSLESGSVSALHYGQVISSDIVSSIIISSVGTVFLTSITRSVETELDVSKLKIKLLNIMSAMTFVVAGITALYFVEGTDLIRFFFQRGSFDGSNTALVSSVATSYSVGFVFSANRDILVKAHYAFKDTKSPMINSIAGVVVNAILSIVLAKIMGIAGVALATSIAMIFVFVMSAITLKKHIKEFILEKSFFIDFLKSLISVVITVLIGKVVFSFLGNINYFVRMIIIGISMCALYFTIAIILHEETAIGLIKNKITKTQLL